MGLRVIAYLGEARVGEQIQAAAAAPANTGPLSVPPPSDARARLQSHAGNILGVKPLIQAAISLRKAIDAALLLATPTTDRKAN
jgi:hypothetical protein